MSRLRTPKQYALATAAFKTMARYTWRTLAARHQLNMRWPEVAITNELVYRLAKARLPHVQIYEAINESIYGHDIDLYIEALPNQYVHLSLQAKVMFAEPAYKPYPAIKHMVEDKQTSNDVYQWQLLDRYQTERIPFYLFYNGFSKNDYNTLINSTKRGMPLLQGCSVMHLEVFKNRFLTSSWGLAVSKRDINYRAVNEPGSGETAVPWHYLFDIERWLREALKINSGQRMKYYTSDALLDGKLYRKLQVPATSRKQSVLEEFPSGSADVVGIAPASFRVLVSMSSEEISESRWRKLALLIAD